MKQGAQYLLTISDDHSRYYLIENYSTQRSCKVLPRCHSSSHGLHYICKTVKCLYK